ncbi:MAG: DJ-1/PfpI family protein [Limnochordia bacterium]|jgi:protease I|nr:DJ-1/PfpI family protein [Bacillota bacterium]
MKKVALVIAEREFRDEEYQVPHRILKEAGFSVLTASTSTSTAVGKLGLKVRPDTLISDLKPDELDALVFIGGGGSEQYFDDPLAHRLASAMVELDRVLGAICIAPVILAKAKVLEGKKATVFPDGASILKQYGADYTGSDVEIDGKIITGNGPDAADAFGRSLIRLLS